MTESEIIKKVSEGLADMINRGRAKMELAAEKEARFRAAMGIRLKTPKLPQHQPNKKEPDEGGQQ